MFRRKVGSHRSTARLSCASQSGHTGALADLVARPNPIGRVDEPDPELLVDVHAIGAIHLSEDSCRLVKRVARIVLMGLRGLVPVQVTSADDGRDDWADTGIEIAENGAARTRIGMDQAER